MSVHYLLFTAVSRLEGQYIYVVLASFPGLSRGSSQKARKRSPISLPLCTIITHIGEGLEPRLGCKHKSPHLVHGSHNAEFSLFILNQPHIPRAEETTRCLPKLLHEILIVAKSGVHLFL